MGRGKTKAPPIRQDTDPASTAGPSSSAERSPSPPMQHITWRVAKPRKKGGKRAPKPTAAPAVSTPVHSNTQVPTIVEERAPSPAVTAASASSKASKPRSFKGSPFRVFKKLLHSTSKSTLGSNA
ncbi:hypothetical protein C8Q77DRAFT_1161108 [Trametes polyzona]|nr:hypothetical protein C8Q77DRAFT_1161108 [Trametes polyzona]